MNKQEAFQTIRTAIARRKILRREIPEGQIQELVLSHLQLGLQAAEKAVCHFRDYVLAGDAAYFSERELLAANKAMVLRAEYRKLASQTSLTEYQEIEFEAEVLEDQFLILAKGI